MELMKLSGGLLACLLAPAGKEKGKWEGVGDGGRGDKEVARPECNKSLITLVHSGHSRCDKASHADMRANVLCERHIWSPLTVRYAPQGPSDLLSCPVAGEVLPSPRQPSTASVSASPPLLATLRQRITYRHRTSGVMKQKCVTKT